MSTNQGLFIIFLCLLVVAFFLWECNTALRRMALEFASLNTSLRQANEHMESLYDTRRITIVPVPDRDGGRYVRVTILNAHGGVTAQSEPVLRDLLMDRELTLVTTTARILAGVQRGATKR